MSILIMSHEHKCHVVTHCSSVCTAGELEQCGSSIKDIRGHRHLSDFIPKPKKCEDVDSYASYVTTCFKI